MKKRILRIIPVAWHGYAKKLSSLKSRWNLIYGPKIRQKYEIVDVYLSPAMRRGFLGKIGYYIAYFIGAILTLLRSLIYGKKIFHAEFPYTVPLAAFCSTIKRGKFIVDWTDVEPYIPPYLHAKKSRKLKAFVIKLVHHIFLKHAALVLVGTGWARENVLLLPNMQGKVIFFPNIATDVPYREKRSFDGVLLYYGKLVPEYKIERLVYMMYFLRHLENSRLILVGAGDDKYILSLMKLAEKLGVKDKIELKNPMPYKELIKFMVDTADICVLPFGASSLKLWEWAAAGKPIISLGHYIEDLGFKNGINAIIIRENTKDSKNDINLAKKAALAAEKLFMDPEYRKRLGRNAYKLAQQQNIRVLEQRFLKRLDFIMKTTCL